MKKEKKKSIFVIFVTLLFLITIHPLALAIELNDLTDVNTDSAVNCNFLHYNGSMWINYDLWNESITWYEPHIFLDTISASSYFGDGGNLTNITLSLPSYINSNAHPHEQDLNTSSDVLFATLTAILFGDGGNITNISTTIPVYITSIGHPHNQDVNTTSSPTFNDLTLTAFPYLDKDYTNDMTSFIGHPHNQDLNTSNSPTFNDISLTSYPNLDKDSTNDMTSFIAHPHNQDLNSTSAVTFSTVDTGQGANELYDMNQNVLTSSSPTFVTPTVTSINTGYGNNELFDMNQHVQTTDTVSFYNIHLATGGTIGYIDADTSDGSDNNYIEIAGGGGGGGYSRGAFIILYGNEYVGANGGMLISMGDGSATNTIQFMRAGSSFACFDSNGDLGLNDGSPDYKIELPNNADATGRGRANQWVTYSDNRTKNFLGELPTNKVMQLYNETKIQYYNPINNTQDKNGTITIGEIDYTKMMVGVDAQDLYYRMIAMGWNPKLIGQLVYRPINQNIDYWSIDYHTLTLTLIEGCRKSLAENTEHIKHIENWLKNYGYTPLNWDYNGLKK